LNLCYLAAYRTVTPGVGRCNLLHTRKTVLRCANPGNSTSGTDFSLERRVILCDAPRSGHWKLGQSTCKNPFSKHSDGWPFRAGRGTIVRFTEIGGQTSLFLSSSGGGLFDGRLKTQTWVWGAFVCRENTCSDRRRSRWLRRPAQPWTRERVGIGA
jgi:hypothetical protein